MAIIPPMEITDVLAGLRMNGEFMRQVTAWEQIPPRPGHYTPLPDTLAPQIRLALVQRGISNLYRHQAQALTLAQTGHNIVVATPTASGKSLCYTLPVVQALMREPNARALYLFPTKALAHDQINDTAAFLGDGNIQIPIHAYDGDTPRNKRTKIRRSGGILVTNPDMLHAGMLPYHTSWQALFANLRYIVIDEIHNYRGVFGSHVANVLRRLWRICAFYGSSPQLICCSATIANPRKHAERLTERPFTLIANEQNGAPSGIKHFILYNPPIVDEELGIRQSSILCAKDAAASFLVHDIQTIVFGRARQTVELLLTYLQDDLTHHGRPAAQIAGYRGGYLASERRLIENGLRSGTLTGVVATNALELGIDVGQLDAAILTGYPGSIASTWQQAGRAGRGQSQSAVILIASGSPLDQYIARHPRYLFGQSPEYALINPDNLRLLAKHILCATYELPLQKGEPFGQYGAVDALLNILHLEGVVHETQGQYHWLGSDLPSRLMSLRTSGDEPVLIQDISDEQIHVIGELELESAPSHLHEGAIYMHQARTYLVERLDWDGRMAAVRPVDADYYTRATIHSTIHALAPEQEHDEGHLTRAYGDVLLVTKAVGYRQIKRYTHETLGFGTIDLPEITLDTSGYWIVLSDALVEKLVAQGVLLAPNNYGPNWETQRQLALARDEHQCQTCQATASPNRPLHVHHIRPFRQYGYAAGQNHNYRQANALDNLVTLCAACHRRAESGQRTRSALGGIAYVLRNLAPLFLMCDPRDIEVSAEVRNPLTRSATVVVYERVPAGIGFSQRLYEIHDQLLSSALELIADCHCRDGCPACVGPAGDIGPNTKAVTRTLIQMLRTSNHTQLS